jgi:hypothetical protein
VKRKRLIAEVAVASVGDRVSALPNKAGQPPRDGVVTAMSGNLLRIRWSSGEETSLIPGAGSVMVVAKVGTGSVTGARGKAANKTPKSPKRQAKGSTKTRSAKPAPKKAF